MSEHLSTRKNFGSITFVVLAAVLTGMLVWNLSIRVKAASTPLPTPYTVKLRQTVVDAAGNALTSDTIQTVAVRNDGSRAVVMETSYREGREVLRYIEFASGGRVEVGDLWDIKTSWPKAKLPPVQDRYRAAQSDCVSTISGKQLLRGERLDRAETLNGIRALKLIEGRNAVWYAPEFGCAKVQARYDFGTSINEHSLIAVIPGEPDATLFHVPESFREVSPSEFELLQINKLKLSCDEKCFQAAKATDKLYYAQR